MLVQTLPFRPLLLAEVVLKHSWEEEEEEGNCHRWEEEEERGKEKRAILRPGGGEGEDGEKGPSHHQ